MTRELFLTSSSIVALLVGSCAVVIPSKFLASKGVTVTPAVVVWMREVGVLIFAAGVMGFLARSEPDSRMMRAFLVGNGLMQLGLLPIELIALKRGVITRLSGVVPNSVLHAVLATGFFFFAVQVSA